MFPIAAAIIVVIIMLHPADINFIHGSNLKTELIKTASKDASAG